MSFKNIELKPGGLVEFLISIAIGAVITLMLTIACVSMVKWATATINSIKEHQEATYDYVESITHY